MVIFNNHDHDSSAHGWDCGQDFQLAVGEYIWKFSIVYVEKK